MRAMISELCAIVFTQGINPTHVMLEYTSRVQLSNYRRAVKQSSLFEFVVNLSISKAFRGRQSTHQHRFVRLTFERRSRIKHYSNVPTFLSFLYKQKLRGYHRAVI